MKNNAGYISTKAVVIAAVLTIIAAIAGVAFWGYVQVSYQIKSDDVAEKAFFAAEAYMKKQVEIGNLEEFNTKAMHFGKALSLELQMKIVEQNAPKEESAALLEQIEQETKEGDIRYIAMESAASDSGNRAENPLLAMFTNYITDANALEGAFLMEYNSKTGQVLTVFYSKEADKLIYNEKEDTTDNIVFRTAEQRKQKKQGYYGVELNELFK